MPSVTTTHVVDRAGLAALSTARTDLVIEKPTGSGDPGHDGAQSWVAERGPFRHYTRTLGPPQPIDQAGPEANGSRPAGTDDQRFTVTERTSFTLAVPLWWPLIQPLMKRALRSPERTPRTRWWWPREVVAAQTTSLVGASCVISVMAGYLGVIIGQTITFAAQDFGNDDAAQANTLAAVRIGVLISILFLHRADRIGRRPLVLGFGAAAIGFTIVGALAPNLVMLGVAQTIARGLTTGLFTLLMLAVTEEVPGTARAFSVSIVAISAAIGGGMVLWILPVADLVSGGWRIIYVVPALFLPVLWWVGRHLPETRRFDAATTASPGDQPPATIDRRRLALLGFAAFAAAVYLSPASQLRNEFLRDDLGYSAGAISVFQLVISAPAGTALLVAGIAADRFGRRWIGAIGLGLGAVLSAWSYQLTGSGLWLVASGGVVLTGAAFPALRGYQTELFPTRARAKVGGLLDGIGVAGSAVGLVAVGYLSDRWDNLGQAIGVMVFAPVLVAILVIVLFPETASKELEVFNPLDPDPDPDAGAGARRGLTDDEPRAPLATG
jgi:MFS family permease